MVRVASYNESAITHPRDLSGVHEGFRTSIFGRRWYATALGSFSLSLSRSLPHTRALSTFTIYTNFRLLTVLDMDDYQYNINRNNKDRDDNTKNNSGSDDEFSSYCVKTANNCTIQ